MQPRWIILAWLLSVVPLVAAEPKPVRLMVHGQMSAEPPSEEFLRFLEELRPDVVVTGVFDQRLYSLAYPPPDSKAKPSAPAELLARWKAVADRLHKHDIRLIGQMEMNVVSDRPLDLSQGTGWFGYFDKGWDDRALGKRPAKRAVDLLEEPDLDPRTAPPRPVPEGDAVARCGCRVNTKALRACINKPAWRETQKRMVKAAVDIGVDGFLTNRNYFGHCACEDCRAGFRKWLAERYSAEERRRLFGNADLDRLALTCVVGMHREIDTVPDTLVLEKQRFARSRVKECFDEVYVRHGRGLRKDLLVGQWNHLAFFDELHLDRGHLPVSTRTTFAHGAADERWGLSPETWGKDEGLIWYCNWGTTQNTILDRKYAGDTVLYGKYVRALARGTPYVINKYDFYRPRNMMAEAAALGYVTNAIATPWQTPADRAVVLRYFTFLRKHEELYRTADSVAEVGLLFPRRAIHAGDAAPLEYVEAAGRALIRRHVLFDLLPDDMPLSLDRFRVVIVTGEEHLSRTEMEALSRYLSAGGKLIVLPVAREDRDRAGAVCPSARLLRRNLSLPSGIITVENARTSHDAFVKELLKAASDVLSTFDAPWTVEAHAYRQPSNRLIVHLVNYDHDEKGTPGFLVYGVCVISP